MNNHNKGDLEIIFCTDEINQIGPISKTKLLWDTHKS